MVIRRIALNSLAPFAMGIIFFVSSASGAAVKPVGGRVTNDGGTPLEGVTVTLLPPDDSAGQTPLQSAKTDADGRYRFDGTQLNGAYRIQAAKEGLLAKAAAIQVGPDVKTHGDLWLEPAQKDPAVIQVDTSDKKPVQ